MLERYEEDHRDEKPCIERVRTLVESHVDCFDRHCLPGHVTASAWIVSDDLERCLLTHHRKLDRWLQLGGHADGDPDVVAVALREAEEESGLRGFEVLSRDAVGRPRPLDVDVHLIPARRNEPAHEHHDIRFLLRAPAGQKLVQSEESIDLGWFSRDAFRRIADEPSLLRMADKAEALLAGSRAGR
jgi:8-oxo-dGTP pyrophosphatase MutT (NUDIX family)